MMSAEQEAEDDDMRLLRSALSKLTDAETDKLLGMGRIKGMSAQKLRVIAR